MKKSSNDVLKPIWCLIVQGAAQTDVDEGAFKYVEKAGVAKDAHIPGAKMIGQLATKASGVYAVGDKLLDAQAAYYEGNTNKAVQDVTVATGFAAATAMMCAPTGVTQIVGGLMFIGFAIYDMYKD